VELQEVVRVTATNLDMSRPLRSADLLAVYHASVVPRPGQVRRAKPAGLLGCLLACRRMVMVPAALWMAV
jgi:hypothetical protein